MTKLGDIEHFLGKKRLAVVGVSHNPEDFTRSLFRELRKRGYDLAPVNPAVAEIDGIECVARLSDVRPPVEAVLLLTSPQVTGAVALECAEAGVESVWMYRASGAGAVNPAAVRSQIEGHPRDRRRVPVHVPAPRRLPPLPAPVLQKGHRRIPGVGAGHARPADYNSIRVPSTVRNCASHSGCAGQAGAVTSAPHVYAASMAISM